MFLKVYIGPENPLLARLRDKTETKNPELKSLGDFHNSFQSEQNILKCLFSKITFNCKKKQLFFFFTESAFLCWS